MADNGVFTKTVDYSEEKAKMWLVETSGRNKFIGSNDESDPGVAHTYNLNQCPVRLVKGTAKIVEIECPCQTPSGPCDHDCYNYG